MEPRVQLAVEMFKDGYSCSQSVVAAYGKCFGVDKDTTLKFAAGLGGGIGRTGSICGAVTGAILVLGLKYGSTDPKNKEAKLMAYQKVQDFCNAFKSRKGSLVCRDLLGFDFMTPEGATRSKHPGAFEHCPEFVQTAAEILESMLQQ